MNTYLKIFIICSVCLSHGNFADSSQADTSGNDPIEFSSKLTQNHIDYWHSSYRTARTDKHGRFFLDPTPPKHEVLLILPEGYSRDERLKGFSLKGKEDHVFILVNEYPIGFEEFGKRNAYIMKRARPAKIGVRPAVLKTWNDGYGFTRTGLWIDAQGSVIEIVVACHEGSVKDSHKSLRDALDSIIVRPRKTNDN